MKKKEYYLDELEKVQQLLSNIAKDTIDGNVHFVANKLYIDTNTLRNFIKREKGH